MPKRTRLWIAGVATLAAAFTQVPTPATADAPVTIAGLTDAVSVRRDSDGIAHINAENAHDMFLVQGWVHARDRLFQMDVLRRQASGTLAELLGPDALASDVELRTIGLRRAAERSWLNLLPETEAAFAAYAAGVNAYVAAHPLPTEYGALELTQFEPWTPVDSLAIAKLLTFSLSFDIDIEPTVALATYEAVGDVAGFDGTALFFEDLRRSAPFDPAATVPDSRNGNTRRTPTPAFAAAGAPHGQGPSAAALGLARAYLKRAENVPLLQGALAPGEQVEGTNEWAVAGEHTLSGNPILANDPHLALGTPATFYPIHLRAEPDGYDAIGDSFAGTPFVILGQNRDLAWGATTSRFDVTDTFAEIIVESAASPIGLGTFRIGPSGSSVEPILPIPQVFRYNAFGGGGDNIIVAAPGAFGDTVIPPVTLIVPRRNNGPIVAIDPPEASPRTALSIQYTGFSGTREADAFHLFNLAQDLDDFVAALQFIDAGSQNFAVADRDGNIAYFSSGEVPLREDLEAGTVTGLPPYFIRNGVTGNEWLLADSADPNRATPYQVLPFAELPQAVNPPAGFVVNANNDPAGVTLDNDPLNQRRRGRGLYYLAGRFNLGLRAGRITELLGEKIADGFVTPEDMQDIQADVALPDAPVFAPQIVQAFDNALEPGAHPFLQFAAGLPGVAEAVGRLEAWDHSAPTGLAEGYDASDVDGVPDPAPSDDEVANSVAATIYAVWRARFVANTVDSVHGAINAGLPPANRIPPPPDEQTLIALRHLLDNFHATQGVGASGIDFFPQPAGADPETRRDVVILASLAEALGALAGPDFAAAFGESPNQDDYRWGYLHRLVLAHPLGDFFSVPVAAGAFPPPLAPLAGIPVDGGFGTVDAARHKLRASGSNDFMFDAGPVRRYVGSPGHGAVAFEAENALPGGASADLTSPRHHNLLERWLTNDTYVVRQRESEIDADTVETVIAVPPPPS